MHGLILGLAVAMNGQLSAPLNDAACVYRAQSFAADNTIIPNEGSRTEPLTLGATTAAESQDPVYEADANGAYLDYTSTSNALANIPPAAMNGAITVALRYQPTGFWADRLLTSIVDAGPTKHFMLHQTSGNKIMARFWDAPPNWSQIGATSTSTVASNHVYNIAVTWDTVERVNRLYINGVQESSGSTGNPRSSANEPGFEAPFAGTILYPSHRLYALALWNRALSASEVASLTTNADWLNSGSPPPPPPPPGVIRVVVNGTYYEGATVAIDGVPVPPPTGSADKVITVTIP